MSDAQKGNTMTDMRALEGVNEHYMETLGLRSQESRSQFLALALCGEAGELANLIKKEWRDGASDARDEEIAEEIADVAIYLHHLARTRGVDINVAIRRKTQKLRERWPEAFTDDAND